MPLKVPGKWIWDFWFARDGADYHIFYLQADNSLGDQHLRHWHVSIGHAVSQDLSNWRILPDALAPTTTANGESVWDDYTTWTGSVIQHNGLWYMFYTGSTRAEDGLVQRIGYATSPNLTQWTKHPSNPVLTADPAYYELLNRDYWHDQAWRDPFIYHDAVGGKFHAFITARSNQGKPDERGVIAHATSDDLTHWDVLPPVTPTGEFGHMEVPQIIHLNNRYYLLFCCPYENFSKARQQRLADNPITGTFYLTSESLEGPYHYDTEGCLLGDIHGTLYSGKVLQGPDDNWYAFGFRNLDVNGNFIGDIIDPLPVQVTEDGGLHVKI